MVGHTGVREAVIEAVECSTARSAGCIDAAQAHGYSVLLTADHGNCDEMVDPITGEPHTQHTQRLVPRRARRAAPEPLPDRAQRAPRQVLLLDGGVVYRMDYAELIALPPRAGRRVTCAARMAGRRWPAAGTELMLHCDDVRPTSGLVSAGRDAGRARHIAPMGVYVIRRAAAGRAGRLAAWRRSSAPADCPSSRRPAPARTSPRTCCRRCWVATRSMPTASAASAGASRRTATGATSAPPTPISAPTWRCWRPTPPLDLYQPDWNILTYQGQYPPARTVPGAKSGNEGIFVNSMLAAGTVIRGGGVSHSVLFPRVEVEDGAIVDEAILFEGCRSGEGAQIRRCICDKDVVIGPGERIGFDRPRTEPASRSRRRASSWSQGAAV
jgi:glucose-1-phosphate adenylyltransferase